MVLKLNSLDITQTSALTLNTLVLFSLETTSLLYGMSLNEITDSNKAHTRLFTCTLSNLSFHRISLCSFSVTHSLLLLVTASLEISPCLHRILTLAWMQHSGEPAAEVLSNWEEPFPPSCPRAEVHSLGRFSSLNGYMPCSGVDCGICGPFCLSGEG